MEAVNPDPMIVMLVPPPVGPVSGLTLVTVGVYVKSDAALAALVPPDVGDEEIELPLRFDAWPVVAVISVGETTTTLAARMAAVVP